MQDGKETVALLKARTDDVAKKFADVDGYLCRGLPGREVLLDHLSGLSESMDKVAKVALDNSRETTARRVYPTAHASALAPEVLHNVPTMLLTKATDVIDQERASFAEAPMSISDVRKRQDAVMQCVAECSKSFGDAKVGGKYGPKPIPVAPPESGWSDEESEKIVLGTIMCDSDFKFAHIWTKLKAQDFTVEKHKTIYEKCYQRYRQQSPPNAANLRDVVDAGTRSLLAPIEAKGKDVMAGKRPLEPIVHSLLSKGRLRRFALGVFFGHGLRVVDPAHRQQQQQMLAARQGQTSGVAPASGRGGGGAHGARSFQYQASQKK